MTHREVWVAWLIRPRSGAGFGRLLRFVAAPTGLQEWHDIVCEAADAIRAARKDPAYMPGDFENALLSSSAHTRREHR